MIHVKNIRENPRSQNLEFHIIILRHYFARECEKGNAKRATVNTRITRTHCGRKHVPAAHVVAGGYRASTRAKPTSRNRRTEQQKYFPTLAGEHLLDLSSIHDHPHHVCFQTIRFLFLVFYDATGVVADQRASEQR